jgi:hypothetical protein
VTGIRRGACSRCRLRGSNCARCRDNGFFDTRRGLGRGQRDSGDAVNTSMWARTRRPCLVTPGKDLPDTPQSPTRHHIERATASSARCKINEPRRVQACAALRANEASQVRVRASGVAYPGVAQHGRCARGPREGFTPSRSKDTGIPDSELSRVSE